MNNYQPNIKFAGRDRYDKGKRKIVETAEPIESFSDRGEVIYLPAARAQKANRVFYHGQAETIAATFPHLYKLVRPKG